MIWLILGGGVVLALFLRWESRRIERGEGALLDPKLLRNLQLRSGVLSFLFMFLVQAGTFFVVPLFLSVALGLSAIETGVRLLPLSLTLLLFAVGVPKLLPERQPAAGRQRRVPADLRRARAARRPARHRRRARRSSPGRCCSSGPGSARWPRSSGSVTVSAVPDEQSGEVGGLQNTGTQLGASIGTALAGAILISALTASFFTGIENNPAIPDNLVASRRRRSSRAACRSSPTRTSRPRSTRRASRRSTADAVVDENAEARIAGLRSALAVLALIALLALLVHPRPPDRAAGRGGQAGRAAGLAVGVAGREAHEQLVDPRALGLLDGNSTPATVTASPRRGARPSSANTRPPIVR